MSRFSRVLRILVLSELPVFTLGLVELKPWDSRTTFPEFFVLDMFTAWDLSFESVTFQALTKAGIKLKCRIKSFLNDFVAPSS